MKWYLALKVVEKHKQVTPKMAADAWISVKTAAFSTKKLMAAALFGLKVFFLNHISFFFGDTFWSSVKGSCYAQKKCTWSEKICKKNYCKIIEFFLKANSSKKSVADVYQIWQSKLNLANDDTPGTFGLIFRGFQAAANMSFWTKQLTIPIYNYLNWC